MIQKWRDSHKELVTERVSERELVCERFTCSGSGRGSVSRAVASDNRDPRFESSHRQILLAINFNSKCFEKTKIKKKRPSEVHLFKIYILVYSI